MLAFMLFLLAGSPEAFAGWIQLFDGETLFGWHAPAGSAWRAEKGVLKAEKGAPGWIETDAAFGDFRLRLEYRVPSPEAASAVGLRRGRDSYTVRIGDTNAAEPTGSIAGRAKAKAPKPAAGAWRALDITARGTRITVRLDGKTVSQMKHFGAIHGPVGLEFTGSPVEFRHLRLKPLDMACLFNGDEVRGAWESPQLWDDFILQVDTRGGRMFYRDGLPVEKTRPHQREEWATETVAVRGRRLNVWVDGYPVTSAETPADRLRRGKLKLETAEPAFRNLCIAPLTRR